MIAYENENHVVNTNGHPWSQLSIQDLETWLHYHWDKPNHHEQNLAIFSMQHKMALYQWHVAAVSIEHLMRALQTQSTNNFIKQ